MLKKLLKRLLRIDVKKDEKESEEKESEFEKGVTTGYFLRSIKEIENTINRIEAVVVTKDWMLANFEDKTPELIEWMKKIDERLGRIEELIRSSKNVEKLLERLSARQALDKRLQALVSVSSADESQSELESSNNEELSKKELEAFEIIMKEKEISYEELAKRLNISLSYLRGIVSQLAKKRKELIRFKKDGKGWVKVIG